MDSAQIETMVKRLSAQQVISMIADDSDSISEDVSKHYNFLQFFSVISSVFLVFHHKKHLMHVHELLILNCHYKIVPI